MKTLESRPLQPETDARALIKLFDAVFGYTVSPEMWEWKYRPSWTDRHYSWVGLYGKKIIGYFGAVPLRGRIDGEDVLFFQLADVMVHPKYRLKFDYFGIAHDLLLKDIAENHPRHLLYGFSDHRAFRWFERLGWSALIEKAVSRTFWPYHCPEATVAEHGFTFREWDWTENELDRLWAEHESHHRDGLVRDGEYVRWRYGSHPVFPYRLHGVLHHGAPAGWVVLGKAKRGNNGERKPLPAVDMLLPEGAAGDVLQALAGYLMNPVSTWLPKRVATPGVEEKVTGTHVYHFVDGSAADTEHLRRHLYYTMGDVDWW